MLCVFAGSSDAVPAAHLEAAAALGRACARRGVAIVYGAGRTGCMGRLAQAALAAGGQVTGVIPQHLDTPALAHPGLTRKHSVRDMHARKALMASLANAFIALPGGIGTLEELAEQLTWAQLGLHDKPVGLLDVAGYWSGLLAWLDRAVADGFLAARHRALLHLEQEPEALLDLLGPPSAGSPS